MSVKYIRLLSYFYSELQAELAGSNLPSDLSEILSCVVLCFMRPNMILVYHCSHCPLFIYRHKNICTTKKKLNSHNARKLDKYERNSNKQAVNILYVRSNSLSTQGEHEIQVNKCLKWQKNKQILIEI